MGARAPAKGTLAEVYLRSRRCWLDGRSIRFLAGRDGHPPAMVIRFWGDGLVTGVHITRLRPDGTGKAGTDADKIMLGPSIGLPLVIQDNPERGELAISEGIEDGASLALATGWTVWAAGSWARVAALMALTQSFDRVFVAFDSDQTKWSVARQLSHLPEYRDDGVKAFARAKELRPDIIGLDIAGLLGVRERIDANKAMIRYGLDALTVAVERAELREDLRAGRIGLEAMANKVRQLDGQLEKVPS